MEVVVSAQLMQKNFNDYLKRKRGIMQIDNKDKLCLPRAIVVGRAYIQHFEEKSFFIKTRISKYCG